jgi:hypothetical protein
MSPLIFMGVEMILFDNSILEMYLLNTQTSIENDLIISIVSSCGKGHVLICIDFQVRFTIHNYMCRRA